MKYSFRENSQGDLEVGRSNIPGSSGRREGLTVQTGEKSVKERIEELEMEAGNVEAITTGEIDDILSQ